MDTREMTLAEWVAKLSKAHYARKEYERLITKRDDHERRMAQLEEELTISGTVSTLSSPNGRSAMNSQYEGHTPGPWVSVNVGEKNGCVIVGRLSDRHNTPILQEEAQALLNEDYDCKLYTEGVCDINLDSNDDPQANARLIADAPLLAEQVEQQREVIERLKDELIRMELWADTGVNTGEVDKQHIYLSRIRGRIRMLLTEWERRNETA